MRLRSTVATVVLTTALTLPLGGTALAADLDCGDFPSQAAAQAALVADPSDPHRLDRDDDGVACEYHVYAPTAGTGTRQVTAVPAGGVAAGDGSAAGASGVLPVVLGGLAVAAAGGSVVAARRTARSRA